MEDLAGPLMEARKPKVALDMGDYVEKVREKAEDLWHWTYDREGEKPRWEPEDEVKRLVAASTKKARATLAKLTAALRRIPEWMSSASITARLYPGDRFAQYPFGADWTDPVGHVHVYLHQGTLSPRGTGGAPSFTMFDDGSLGDVLDSGDRYFFRDQETEIDYFNLVSEIEKPGSTRGSGGKDIVLYTARPVADRSMYKNAKKIPSSVYLTTDYDRAFGLGMELAGAAKRRDVWRVTINSKYLQLQHSAGRIKDYQTRPTKERTVPVKDIEMMATTS